MTVKCRNQEGNGEGTGGESRKMEEKDFCPTTDKEKRRRKSQEKQGKCATENKS